MAYSTKYQIKAIDDPGSVTPRNWVINLKVKDHTGGITQMEAGYPFMQMHWVSEQNDLFDPLFVSSVEFNIIATEFFQYIDLFNEDDRYCQVEILREGSVYWQGWLISDQYKQDYCDATYNLSFTCNDGISDLRNEDFLNEDGSRLIGLYTIYELVELALSRTDLDLELWEGIDVFKSGTSNDTSVIERQKIYAELLYDHENEQPISCYDALYRIVKSYYGRLFQYEGEWVFNHIPQWNRSLLRRNNGQIKTYIRESSLGSNTLHIVNADATLEFISGRKSVKINRNLGFMPNVLKNGDFIAEKWDDVNTPKYWTKVDDPDIIRVDPTPLSPMYKVRLGYNNGPNAYIYTRLYMKRPLTMKISFWYKKTFTHNGLLRLHVINHDGIQKQHYNGTDWDTAVQYIELPNTGSDGDYYEHDILVRGTTMNNYYEFRLNEMYCTMGTGYSEFGDMKISVEYGSENDYNVEVPEVQEVVETNDKQIKQSVLEADTYLGEVYDGSLPDVFWGRMLDENENEITSFDYSVFNQDMSLAEITAYVYATMNRRARQVLSGTVFGNSGPDNVLLDEINRDEFGRHVRFFPVDLHFDAQNREWSGIWHELLYDLGDELITSLQNGDGLGGNEFEMFVSDQNSVSVDKIGYEGGYMLTNAIPVTVDGYYHICVKLTLHYGDLPYILYGPFPGQFAKMTNGNGYNQYDLYLNADWFASFTPKIYYNVGQAGSFDAIINVKKFTI